MQVAQPPITVNDYSLNLPIGSSLDVLAKSSFAFRDGWRYSLRSYNRRRVADGYANYTFTLREFAQTFLAKYTSSDMGMLIAHTLDVGPESKFGTLVRKIEEIDSAYTMGLLFLSKFLDFRMNASHTWRAYIPNLDEEHLDSTIATRFFDKSYYATGKSAVPLLASVTKCMANAHRIKLAQDTETKKRILYDAKYEEWADSLTDVREFKHSVKNTGIGFRDKLVFTYDSQLLGRNCYIFSDEKTKSDMVNTLNTCFSRNLDANARSAKFVDEVVRNGGDAIEASELAQRAISDNLVYSTVK